MTTTRREIIIKKYEEFIMISKEYLGDKTIFDKIEDLDVAELYKLLKKHFNDDINNVKNYNSFKYMLKFKGIKFADKEKKKEYFYKTMNFIIFLLSLWVIKWRFKNEVIIGVGPKKGLKEWSYTYYKMPIVEKGKRKEYNREYYLKTKEKQKEKFMCSHNKMKSVCKECGGASICPHDKRKSRCIECGGGSLCIHKKDKSQCKECGGVSICSHNRQRSQCKECGGASICPHNRIKSSCKECGGGSVCPHDRIKSTCRECGGGSICPHDRNRAVCKECGGGSICPHNKRKDYCVDCGGSSICHHKKQKRNCKICSLYTYLVALQRGRLNKIIKKQNLIKTQSTIEYLDCSPVYFKEYLQSKLIEGMTFDNIHIDHIKPVSRFNLEDPEELLKCCHYSNFQPLISTDNLEKGNRWTEADEIFWNENIIYKEYLPIYNIK